MRLKDLYPAVRVVLGLFALTAASALAAPGPSVQAINSFMSLLDHRAVLAAEEALGSDSDGIAERLLANLEERAILAPWTAQPIRDSIRDRLVDRTAFVFFLTDLLNGYDVLDTEDVREAESRLQSWYCGLVIPAGRQDATRAGLVLNNHDVGEVVQQFIAAFDCLLPSLRDTYGEPVE